MIKLLETKEDWQELKENEPILIVFKHSKTCPVSMAAKERLSAVDYLLPNIYELIVQESGELSGFIAQELELKHESPQVLVLHQGKLVYDRDHDQIRGDELVDFVKNLQRENK